MPSLSDKLKSLGVKVGTQDIPQARPRNQPTIESVIGGSSVNTPFGETYIVDSFYPPEQQNDSQKLWASLSLDVIAAWAGDERINNLAPTEFAFLDTETTGLSGGTGTYAFLVGIARYEQDTLHLSQFFMRDPIEEPALLLAIEKFLAPCRAVVTFNGKAFDIPLLSTRYTTQGWLHPFHDMAHLDLLHLARRLWRDRLPSRTLSNLEVQILGTTRTMEDVPGWMIPEIFFEYLRNGDANPLKGVFYHNAMDVISLAVLFNHCAWILTEPLNNSLDNGSDIVALGKLYETLGDYEMAANLYRRAILLEPPETTLLEAVNRLATLHKKQDDYLNAISLWEKAAGLQHLDAHIELAKYYEHRLRDYPEAARWVQDAIALVERSSFTAYEHNYWLKELKYRLDRLNRKFRSQKNK